jgi:uncharacterized protein (DUF433 family)
MSRLGRIATDPSICHGQPTIRGLRYPVESLLELLASGMTIEEVIADHPDLEPDDFLAALESGLSRLVNGVRCPRALQKAPGGRPAPSPTLPTASSSF